MSDETKFTDGEWHIKETAPLVCAWTFDFDKMGLGFSIDREEFEANVHLIKTAPKLYAALSVIVKGEGLTPGVTIESLLAEARGEQCD